MAYFDPIGALTQFLRGNAVLAAEVTRLNPKLRPPANTTWIMAGQLPGTFDGGKAVFIPGSGGSVDVTMTQRNVQIRCYGTTIREATELWVTLMDALHDVGPVDVPITGGVATLGKVRLISGPEPGIEPETDWRYVLSLWDIIWYGRKV
jgi:hypothetical protein